jgi:hypothetical protein
MVKVYLTRIAPGVQRDRTRSADGNCIPHRGNHLQLGRAAFIIYSIGEFERSKRFVAHHARIGA